VPTGEDGGMPAAAARAELRVERVVAGGDGLARGEDGRVVFVAGALPGERVVAQIEQQRRDFSRAAAVEVLEASPWRRSPPCPAVAAGCGGCGWQHVDPDGQRELKRDIVADALRRLGGLADPVVEVGRPLDPVGYRTTVRVGLYQGRPGFRAASSHELVPVDHCLVAHPLVDDLLRTTSFGAAAEATLRCGVATGERLVLAHPDATGVDVPAGVVLASAAAPDDAAFHEVVAGHRFRVSATAFFQTRADGAAALVEEVRVALDGAPAGRLVDAYAGVGLFAATVAADRPVVAVEQHRAAVADARVNLAGHDARVVRADVARWRPVDAPVVIADPARAGLGRIAAGVLAGTGAARLVLVSCDPASLGRDSRLLAGHGFRHQRSVLVDLFPHTPHVEVVTTFLRA